MSEILSSRGLRPPRQGQQPGKPGVPRYCAPTVADSAATNSKASSASTADAPYRAGRRAAWLKVKCLGREEFVMLGWMPSGGYRRGIGALAIGCIVKPPAVTTAGRSRSR
jgi:hypothetical protein